MKPHVLAIGNHYRMNHLVLCFNAANVQEKHDLSQEAWCSQKFLKQTNCSEEHNSWLEDQNFPCGSLLWAKLYPPSSYVEVLAPVGQNETLSGNRFTAMYSTKMRWPKSCVTRVPIKRGHLDTEAYAEGRHCDKTQGEDSHLQAAERGLNTASLTALRKNQPCDTLIPDFWPLDLWKNKFLRLKPPSWWLRYSRTRRLTQSLQTGCYCWSKGQVHSGESLGERGQHLPVQAVSSLSPLSVCRVGLWT